MPIRIVIADDQALIRAGLRSLLETDASALVVGEAADGLAAVDQTLALEPDIVLMDIGMPRLNGFDATARLVQAGSPAKVIVLSLYDDELTARRAIKAGAKGYVLKSAGVDELWAAIRAVSRGQSYFVAPIGDYVAGWASGASAPDSDPMASLSPRQREVLQMIAEGMSTKEIAHQLHLSVSTIDSHRSELMRRLNKHDVASLVRFAIEHRLTDFGPRGTP